MTSLILDFRFTDNMVLIGWARRPTGMIVMANDFLHAFLSVFNEFSNVCSSKVIIPLVIIYNLY